MTLPVEMTIGLYVEKIADAWKISNPDGTCFDGPFDSKRAATRALKYYRHDHIEARK